jgi:hypothetical protein
MPNEREDNPAQRVHDLRRLCGEDAHRGAPFWEIGSSMPRRDGHRTPEAQVSADSPGVGPDG